MVQKQFWDNFLGTMLQNRREEIEQKEYEMSHKDRLKSDHVSCLITLSIDWLKPCSVFPYVINVYFTNPSSLPSIEIAF